MNKIKTVLLVSVMVGGSLSNFAFAQVPDEGAIKNAIQQAKENFQEQQKQQLESLKSVKMQAREDFQKKLDAARKDLKSKIEGYRMDLKKKLDLIKDSRRRDVASSTAERINDLNERLADGYSAHLNNLEDLLMKFVARVDQAEKDGKNIADVRARIELAKTAIANARAKVLVQKQVVYKVSFTSDTNVGQAFRKVVEQFKNDQQAIRDGVLKDAREAVRVVIKSMNVILGEKENSESETATSTPAVSH